MTRRFIPPVLGSLLVFVALTGGRSADDTYAPKLRDPKPGETTWHERTAVIDMYVKLSDPAGDTLVDRREKGTATTTYWQQVQARSDRGQVTKLRRGYGAARTKDADGNVKTLPFEGIQVNFQADAAGKFRFLTAKGSELKGKDAKVLAGEFNHGSIVLDRIMPDRAVKVGDSWNIKSEVPAFFEDDNFSLKLDAAKAKFTGQLTKVYAKDGVQHAIVTVRWEVPVLTLNTPAKKFTFEKDSTFIAHLTADAPLDGSSPYGTFKKIGYLKCADHVVAEGKKFALSVVARYDEEEIIKPPPKK